MVSNYHLHYWQSDSISKTTTEVDSVFTWKVGASKSLMVQYIRHRTYVTHTIIHIWGIYDYNLLDDHEWDNLGGIEN